jgi:hypothetical protein
MPDSFQADSFQPEPNEKKSSFLGGIKKSADEFILRHLDELAQKKSGILNPDPAQNPLMDKPILPEINRFNRYDNVIPRAAQGIYNQVVRPFTSPLGILGLGIDPEKVGSPQPPEVKPPVWAPKPKVPLQLGAAPEHIANPPKFIAGPTGNVAPANIVDPSLAARLANMGTEGHPQTTGLGSMFSPAELAEQRRQASLMYGPAEQYPGTRLQVPDVEPAIPPTSGDTRGGFSEQTGSEMGYPYNVVPNRMRPRTAQSNVLSTTGLGHVEPPVKPPVIEPSVERVAEPPVIDENARPSYVGAIQPGEPVLPSAINRPARPAAPGRTTRDMLKGIPPKQAAPQGGASSVAPIIDAEIVKKPIKPTVSTKQAVQDWANGRKAANQYGRNAADEFRDLDDPTLIDKYQAGDRSGRLTEVQDHLDQLRQNEVLAGVLPEDAVKANYLRQYWEQTPEQVDKIFAGLIAKTPAFAKESVFQSYRQGIAAGLTPKFQTLPEILEARTADSVRAIKNKQFYDYLQNSGKVKPGVTIPNTQDIDKISRMFKDPADKESKELIRYISNYLGDSSGPIKKTADVVSLTKNIYLGGGGPGTKYNMHGINTAKSDSKLRGFITGIKEFVTDPTGNKALEFVNSKESKARIAKLMEYGYQYHPVEDMGHAVSQPLGPAIGSIVEAGQNIFEKPLFERSLPAMKLKGANYAFDKLTKAGVPEEDAYRQAAKIANEFYGGMDKSIRNKSGQDAARIVALAPDWLESRVKLAANDWKGAAKTIVGKGTPADVMHAKSLARGAAMAGAGAVGSAYGYGSLTKPQDVTNIPIGTDAKGKQRVLDVLGTADEAMRLPIQLPLRASQGDPMAFLKMYGENKMSQPAKTIMHLAQGRDEFGRPFSGKNISGAQSFRNNLYEASRPFMYQGVQGFIDYMNDRSSAEEAASQGLELPLKYETKPKTGLRLGGLGSLK